MIPRVATTLAKVAEETGVPVTEILGRCKVQKISQARHLAMARVRALVHADGRPVLSYPRIGLIFKRDHSTAVHGVKVNTARNGPCPPLYPASCVIDFEETRL